MFHGARMHGRMFIRACACMGLCMCMRFHADATPYSTRACHSAGTAAHATHPSTTAHATQPANPANLRSPACREPSVRQLYKEHMSYMLGRTNTVSGQPYSSDPTIYGWDVLNEPRSVEFNKPPHPFDAQLS